jgi:hypothetical protein
MSQDEVWPIERPLYDIRFDAYWLVTREAHQYRFVGPVMLSAALLGVLPEMTAEERIEAQRHLPSFPDEQPGETLFLSPIAEPVGC